MGRRVLPTITPARLMPVSRSVPPPPFEAGAGSDVAVACVVGCPVVTEGKAVVAVVVLVVVFVTLVPVEVVVDVVVVG